MDYSKTPPNVCFKAQFAPPMRASNELRRLLETHLGARVGLVQRRWAWFLHPWVADLQAGDRSFTLVLTRNKNEQDEWIILVGSNEVPFRWMIGHKAPEYVLQLKLVCREIHALLATTPGITRVRWYFQGSGYPSDAVATPDELSWVSE